MPQNFHPEIHAETPELKTNSKPSRGIPVSPADDEVQLQRRDHHRHRKSCKFPSRGERGEKRWEAVKTSRRMADSSSPEEKKLGFPFSENGPSSIQGEGATSPFSDLGEWEVRGVTTPSVVNLLACSVTLRWTLSYFCLSIYLFVRVERRWVTQNLSRPISLQADFKRENIIQSLSNTCLCGIHSGTHTWPI
jgi:hypothetical protein